jgi:putative glutamine amidotransferase
MIIGMTDPEKEGRSFERYAGWLHSEIPGLTIRMFSPGAAEETLEGCSGLVLTGGGDVDPVLYGRGDARGLVHTVVRERDDQEFALIHAARVLHLPVLGICRGAQVFAVSAGGTLYPDLEQAGFQCHTKEAGVDRVHGVRVEPRSMLAEIVGSVQGEVNSSHHQAVERPGPGLRVVARSTDGVPEAVEWEDPAGKPFLLLLQWHPERMADRESPFSRGVLRRFAREVALRKERVIQV